MNGAPPSCRNATRTPRAARAPGHRAAPSRRPRRRTAGTPPAPPAGPPHPGARLGNLFSTGGSGLLGHTLLGAPLGGHWTQALADGGPFGPHGLVYLGLFALVTAVATWNVRRARAAAARRPDAAAPALPGAAGLTKALPLLSYATLITVAVVPLAAALYVVTTTAWTAAERALLHRDRPAMAAGASPDDGARADAVPARS
ncbi:hypothetical protein [Streptomyces benahoarensis]|uniref:hypothetical protein n=1 Tax=Streptomyces benahoarensis TaxID=2595054 RepID=UPI0032DEC8F0